MAPPLDPSAPECKAFDKPIPIRLQSAATMGGARANQHCSSLEKFASDVLTSAPPVEQPDLTGRAGLTGLDRPHRWIAAPGT
jgi:hypothetical protein